MKKKEIHIRDKNGNYIFSHKCKNNSFRRTLDRALILRIDLTKADLINFYKEEDCLIQEQNREDVISKELREKFRFVE